MSRVFITFTLIGILIFVLGCGSRTKVEIKYPDGSLKSVHYEVPKDGDTMPDGPASHYYQGGKIQFEFQYVMGEMTGPYKKYYPNGTVSEEGTFKNGSNVGDTKTYFDNGNLQTSAIYNENGQKHGKFISYDQSGKISQEKNFVNGK